MDPEREDEWPRTGDVRPAPRDLEGEAMRRRIRSHLFGEIHPAVQIGRFKVIATLGQGGMGIVYAAEDEKLDRRVAIKVIRDDRLREGVKERARLLREARMQARLSHPNVVQIHEVGEYEGGVFIVMELVRGTTLREWLDREPRPPAAILKRFVEAGRGLAAAHRAGIVHRDFKLQNVLVDADGRVRISDFGLARGDVAYAETDPERRGADLAADPMQHATSKYGGTPAYMSPEQVRGLACDARSDQYSFSVALAEAVCGRPPLPAHQRLVRSARESPVPPDRRLPRWLREALIRGLALRPEDRHASMDALIAVLVDGPRRRRRGYLAAGVALALAAATAVGAALRSSEAPELCPDPRERFAGVWDEARRETIRTAFMTTGLVYAGDTWQRTSVGLDDFAERWAMAWRDNCRATRERGEQSEHFLDRSALCLERGRSAWTTLLTMFAAADAALVADAEMLVAGLPAPEHCRSLATLLADRSRDRPDDPADAALRELLDRAQILLRTNQARAAADLLTAGLTQIRAAGDVAKEAEALLLLGKVQGRLLADGAGAIQSLHQAYDRASAAERTDLTWDVWSSLAWVHSDVLDAPAEARVWLTHAQSTRPQDSPPAEAALLAVEAEILGAEGRADESLAPRRAALARLRSYYDPAHPEVMLARQALAAGLGEAGRLEEARAHDAQLLDELRDQFGAEHPWPARVELNLGLDLLELGESPRARAHLEHARDVLVRTYGGGHRSVAHLDIALAQLDAEDDLERAIARAEAGLASYDATLPRTHAERAMALVLLAELYRVSERSASLLAVSRELLEIHDAGPGHKDLDVPALLANIGDQLCQLHRCSEALPYFSRLMTLYLDEPPAEAWFRAAPLRGIGLVHLARGEPGLAVAFLEEAFEIFETSAPGRPGTARELADALAALRRAPRRVRQLRQRAAALEAAGE